MTEQLTQYWYAFPVVALGCALTVMGGVGGNTICGPFFILVLRLPPESAIGTALITEVFSMSSGLAGYSYRKLIDYRLALLLAAAAAPMAIAGSFLSVRAPSNLLTALFGTAIVFIALVLFRSPEANVKGNWDPKQEDAFPGSRKLVDKTGRVYLYRLQRIPQLMLTSMAAGLGSGLVGIGGGEFNTPSMVIRSRIPLRVAAATAVFVMALTVFAGAGTHLLLGRPLWNLALWTIPGAVVGGQLGSYLASRLPSEALGRWLSWLFLAVGGLMVLRAVL